LTKLQGYSITTHWFLNVIVHMYRTKYWPLFAGVASQLQGKSSYSLKMKKQRHDLICS